MSRRVSAHEEFGRNVKSALGDGRRDRLLLNVPDRPAARSAVVAVPDPETGVIPAGSPARHESAKRRDPDPRRPFGHASYTYDEIVEAAVRDADVDFNSRSRGGS